MEMFFAAFLLFNVATHDSFGTVMDPTPLTRAECLDAIQDEGVIEIVKSYVKEHTGEDVEVTGVCKPVDTE